MKFSVIIPAYNVEHYIADAIESVRSQSYVDWELIIVNDGSTDSTLSICKYFESKDIRINIVSICNSGVSVARNIGIKKAIGDYLFFLDADDVLGEEIMCQVFEKLSLLNYKPDVIFCSYDRFNEHTGIRKHYSFDFHSDLSEVYGLEIWEILFGHNPIFSAPIMAQVYKTDLIKGKNVFFDPNLFISEDHDWRYLLLTTSIRYYAVNFSCFTYMYRENNNNSVTYSIMTVEKFENNYIYLEKWYKNAIICRNLADIKKILLGRIAEDCANKSLDIIIMQNLADKKAACNIFLKYIDFLKNARFIKYKALNIILRIFGLDVYLCCLSFKLFLRKYVLRKKDHF